MTFRTKQQALTWAVEQEANPADPHSLSFAVERFIREVLPSHRGRRWARYRLLAFQRSASFIDKSVSEITSDDIGQWRDARLKEVAGSSVARELNLIQSVFESARREWKWCLTNPVRDVRKPPEPQPRKVTISDSQRDAILGALRFDGRRVLTQQHRVAVAFLFALETAMRASEITSLQWSEENLKKRYVSLLMTKNGEARDVPLSKKAVKLLRMVPGGFGVTSGTLDAMFRDARDRAAPGIVFHDTRRTATTRLAKKLKVEQLAKVTGHKDLRILLSTYYQPTASDLAKLLD